LSHHAQGVEVGPLFGDPASRNAKDVSSRKRHTLSRWGDSLKVAMMGTAPGVANRYFVPLSNYVLGDELKVREGSGVREHQLLGLLNARDRRATGKVQNVGWGEQVVKEGRVMHTLAIKAANEDLIGVGGHEDHSLRVLVLWPGCLGRLIYGTPNCI
jgi:hypothetical protein